MKKFFNLVSIVFIVFVLTGCNNNLNIEQKVDRNIKKMTLDEKIAQMLVIYYTSSNYDNTLKSTIKNVKPGGFILFKENIRESEQLYNFINNMQNDSEIPMFISIDQEGGLVQRLKNIEGDTITTIPAMQKLGNTEDENLAYQVGEVIAKELNAFGINMNFAPVIDINSNPENSVIGSRAFGDNYALVSKMGIALAKGMSNNNIIPVYKHFPGHGDTEIDSHYDLPVLNKTKEELYELELKPFIDAINNNAQVIMVGHLAVPKLTGDNTPASLSQVVINDLLREELRFNGVVITDALNMGAVTKNYTTKEILVKAINAGVDLLLMPGSSKNTLSIIKDAIKNNEIKESKIDDAVRRILTLKYNSGLFDEIKLNDKSVLGSVDHQYIINQIVDKSKK